jgi:hypothetical protein
MSDDAMHAQMSKRKENDERGVPACRRAAIPRDGRSRSDNTLSTMRNTFSKNLVSRRNAAFRWRMARRRRKDRKDFADDGRDSPASDAATTTTQSDFACARSLLEMAVTHPVRARRHVAVSATRCAN